MRITVRHTIDDLANDLVDIAARAEVGMMGVVRDAAINGNRVAQGIAKGLAGAHGSAYYKRLTAEARGPLKWEYGPEGIPKSDFVGVGFRNGPGNQDLPKSADIAGADLLDKTDRLVQRLFW